MALDWRLAATPDDLAALRSAGVRAASTDRYAVLEAVRAFAAPPRRDTAAGWAPFRLDAGSGRLVSDSDAP